MKIKANGIVALPAGLRITVRLNTNKKCICNTGTAHMPLT